LADTITSATTWKEQRHQGDAGAEYSPTGIWGIRARYALSHEPDYLTNTASLGFRQDLFERMSTVSADYRLSIEEMGMSTDPDFGERTVLQGLDLSWRQILDRHTVATVLLSGEYSQCGETVGCVANPYRFVGLQDSSTTVLAIHERNPETLLRGAAGTRLSRALGQAAAVHGSYRFYADSWLVTGHTAQLEGAASLLDERLMLRSDARASTQGAASFYRDSYQSDLATLTVPTYRTNDRELSGLLSLRAGGSAEWSWYDVGQLMRLAVDARLARAWYRYPNYPELPQRNAWIAGGGMHAEF